MSEINETSIQELFRVCRDDPDEASFIRESLQTFSTYAAAIFRSETYKISQGGNAFDSDELAGLEKMRSNAHDAVIACIQNLNCACGKNNIPPIYNGTISEKYPYRVEIADAVLRYVQRVLENRIR